MLSLRWSIRPPRETALPKMLRLRDGTPQKGRHRAAAVSAAMTVVLERG